MTKYWVGGTGNTSDATNHWATTSGGSPGAGNTPTAADDLIFNASSGVGTVTINAALAGRSLQTAGSSVTTCVHAAAITLTLGDGTAGASNIALDLSGFSTYTLGSATTSAITFVSTSTTQQTVNFNGKTTGNITFSGVGGNYKLTAGHTVAATASVTVGTGNTFDFNGQTVSYGAFSASVGTRTVNAGAAQITITGTSGTAWNLGPSAGLTTSLTSSTITFTGTSAGLSSGGSANAPYGTIIVQGSGTFTCASTFKVNTFTRVGTASQTDVIIFATGTQIMTMLNLSGAAVNQRLLVQGAVLGTTIAAAAWTLSNVDFIDIAASGVAVPLTGTSMGDCGGNTQITFDAPTTQTHTASGGGNWSDATKWTSRTPLPQDDVVIGSGVTGTLTANMPRMGKNIDFTGFTGTFLLTGLALNTSLYGSLTLATGMTFTSSNNLDFWGRGSYTITNAGKSHAFQVRIGHTLSSASSYTLLDALTVTHATSTLQIVGSFDSGGFAISCASFLSISSITRTVNLRTSTITLNNLTAAAVWNVTPAGLTLLASQTTIVVGTAATTTRTFTGGNQTYGTLTYTVAGSTGSLIITGSNVFDTINFSDVTNARTLQFTSATNTVVNTFNVNGTAGKLMTISAVTAGTPATVIKTTAWNIGINSTLVSGNYGLSLLAGSNDYLSAKDILGRKKTDGNYFMAMAA